MARSNKRLGLIIAFIVILLMLGAMAYIYWFGGINKGPMAPLHSSRVELVSRSIA